MVAVVVVDTQTHRSHCSLAVFCPVLLSCPCTMKQRQQNAPSGIGRWQYSMLPMSVACNTHDVMTVPHPLPCRLRGQHHAADVVTNAPLALVIMTLSPYAKLETPNRE